jgi:TonB family protein
MKYDDSGVKMLLFLILMVVWTMSGDSSSVFNADAMKCDQYAGKPDQQSRECKNERIIGYYKVALSKNSNSCAFYFKPLEAHEPTFTTGRTLTYVDKDNWTCESVPGVGNFALKAVRQDGDLSIQSADLDHIVATWTLDIRPADGPINAIKHWYRMGNQYWTQTKTPHVDSSYVASIVSKIKSNLVQTWQIGDQTENLRAVYRIEQSANGEVTAIKKIKSSGLPAFDAAVESAITRSSPLPQKGDGSVERAIEIGFSPKDDQ